MARLPALLQRARRLIDGGEAADAVPLMEEAFALADVPHEKADLAAWLGSQAAREGEPEQAADWFEAAQELVPRQPVFPFEKARALTAAGEHEAALSAYLETLATGSRNARHFLFAGDALFEAGREAEALDVWSIGDSADPMLRRAKDHPRADRATREASARADRALRGHFSDLHRRTVAAFGEEAARVRNAVWVQTHDRPYAFLHADQRPAFFYMPDLPAVPVFGREDLGWTAPLENAAEAIRAEYLAAMREGVEGEPYVHGQSSLSGDWAPLKGQKRWESLHLYRDGKPEPEVLRHFPRTAAALAGAPLVRVEGEPLEVFFSVLRPGTRIPPHHGLANCRLTVHLPLIIPDDCAIRVADRTCHWREGEILAFDDSFEHEAWNRSEETRVVLIFEAWAPDLSDTERRAIEASYESRLDWLKARRVPEPGGAVTRF